MLALWAGALVSICAVAAPTAFAVLADRSAAGQVAGRLFLTVTIIGVVTAALLFAMQWIAKVNLQRAGLPIAIAALAPLSSELVLGPLMAAARSAGNMARFGMLHGVAALLLAIACVSACVALWKISRPAA